MSISSCLAPSVSRETSPYARRLRRGSRALYRATVSSRAHSANPLEPKETVELAEFVTLRGKLPGAALLAPLHRQTTTSAFIFPSPEQAWPNESMPWRPVPTRPSRRYRWLPAPGLRPS